MCDVAGRLGGDEFVIIFDPVADAEEAVATTSRVLVALEALSVDDDRVGAHCPSGPAPGCHSGGRGTGPWDLVARADDALYLGKRSRRGEVRLG